MLKLWGRPWGPSTCSTKSKNKLAMKLVKHFFLRLKHVYVIIHGHRLRITVSVAPSAPCWGSLLLQKRKKKPLRAESVYTYMWKWSFLICKRHNCWRTNAELRLADTHASTCEGEREKVRQRERPVLVTQHFWLKRLYCENMGLYALLIPNDAGESELWPWLTSLYPAPDI